MLYTSREKFCVFLAFLVVAACIGLVDLTGLRAAAAQPVSERLSFDPAPIRDRIGPDLGRLDPGRLGRRLDEIIRDLEEVRGGVAAPPQPGPLVRGFLAARINAKNLDLPIEPDKPRIDETIYLPGLLVTLRNLDTGEQSEPVRTDLSGRFNANVPERGRYELCFEGGGFDPGCLPQIVMADRKYRNLGTFEVSLPRDPAMVAVYGNVSFADGAVPRAFEPLFNVNAFVTISVTDPRGAPLLSVPVNNDGLYLVPRVPLGEFLLLQTRIEGYSSTQGMQLGNPAFRAQQIDLILDNRNPAIQPLVALDARGERIGQTRAGSDVSLLARVEDADGDSIKYLWSVTDGTLSDSAARDPVWKLPRGIGNHAATLIAFDGRGGYAKASVNVSTRPGGVTFSGTVKGSDQPALAGAEVEINGRIAVTDSRGFFELSAADRKRFVMTIRRPGYGFVSNVFYDGMIGGTWTLSRAEVFQADPTQVIELENRRTLKDCLGPPSTRIPDWETYPSLAVPRMQDGRGNTIPTPADIEKQPGVPQLGRQEPARDDCGPGIRVLIPANSLVDAAGNRPAGPVEVQLSTVDLASGDQMPGNYSVDTGGGSVGVMKSWGAGIVEIRSSGNDLDLAPGASAELIIPVDRTQLVAGGPLPDPIPLLSYDERAGIWREDGTANLDTSGPVPVYVGKVTHFTAYNTDLIKQDQSCLAMQNQGMPASYALEVTVPQPGGAAPEVIVRTVDGGNEETVLLNLPRDTRITLVPIRTTDPDPNRNGLPMGVFVVNTGAPQNPNWPTVSSGWANEPQGPPYYLADAAGNPTGACSTRVILSDLGLNFYDPPIPRDGAFLHGLEGSGFSNIAAVSLDETDPAFPADANQLLRDTVTAASLAYRREIDPRALRPSLACFKVVNRMPLDAGETCPEHAGTGFVLQTPLTETAAAYANTIDLGFGREMHCVQNGADVACYVSNYDSLVYTGPGEGSDQSKARTAVRGFQNLLAPDATVAMEYSRIEDRLPAGTTSGPAIFSDPERVVKFYVFGGNGAPLDAAELDGLGARPVPQLCMVCHGGAIPRANPAVATQTGVGTPIFAARDDVKLGAKFLPFDLGGLTFAEPDGVPPAPNPPFSKADQQDEFLALNRMVAVAPPPDAAEPSSSVIESLVNAWYPGGVVPQLEGAVVAPWSGDALHATFYQGTIARGCRTCHVANPDSDYRFEAPATFDSKLGPVQLRVCQQHVMPHARRTHDLFWTSTGPSLPAQLQAYGDSLNTGGWQIVGSPGVDTRRACGQEFERGGAAPTVGFFDPIQVSLSACAGCHNPVRAALPASDPSTVAGLDLSPGAYSRLAGVDSEELSTMKRVAVGASTETTSYLWHKIANTHNGLGTYVPPGPGVAMPQFSPGLLSTNPAQAGVIRDWIRAGAAP